MPSRTEKYLLSSVASKDFVHKLRALANVCLWMRSLYLWPNHDDKCQMWQTLEMDTTLSHIAYSPHSVHTQAHAGKGTASNPMSWYITYEPSAAQTFCKYFVKLGRNKKYLSLGSAHYTPNFYISFVIELS